MQKGKEWREVAEEGGRELVPPWPLLVLAGEGHIDDPHQILPGHRAVQALVNLHQFLVLPCGAHRDDEATAKLQLFHKLHTSPPILDITTASMTPPPPQPLFQVIQSVGLFHE